MVDVVRSRADHPPSTGPRPPALRVRLEDGAGFDITEMGTEKRLALWVVRDPEDVPPLAALGPDPLTSDFTVDLLAQRLAEAGGATVKGACSPPSRSSPEWATPTDEALHLAKLSPTSAPPAHPRRDRPAPRRRGHRAQRGVERQSGLAIGELKADKKRAMRVHGKTGEPCPECGEAIRHLFATRSLQYCPGCQTGGRTLADRRLSDC